MNFAAGEDYELAKNRKIVSIVALVCILFSSIIAYRIYANLVESKQRAARVSQGRVVAVEVGRAVRKNITPVLTFSGGLEPVWNADISPKMDGRIDRLNVEEGDLVAAGSVLAVFDTNELAASVAQAEGSLYVAQASLEQAELDLKRAAALAAQGAVSSQVLDTARIKRDLAVGQLRSAEGSLAQLTIKLQNATVEAPRNGVVTKKYLQAGFFAKAGAPIVAVADVSSFLAKATVGEAQIAEISAGTPARVIVDALGGKAWEGSVTRLSPAASLPARSFVAEITMPNADGMLKTGMYARVEIAGRMHANALIVPESALVMKEDQKTVYVVGTDNKVQQKVLKLGYVGQGMAEVLDGLTEGETIVTAGQNKIRDGSNIKVSAPGEGADS